MIPAAPDWTLMRSLLAVLAEGSLSAAARRLGVAHPTMARHIAELEATLGAPLFVRGPTGLVPTPLGESLRDPAQAMQSAYDHLLRTATAQAQAISGTIRIAASEVIGIEVLPGLLAPLRAAHPGLDFELAISDENADLLRRDADIALRMVRPTQGDLVAQKVAEVGLGLYAHRDWIERHGVPADLAQLAAARALIGYDRNRSLIAALAVAERSVGRAAFGIRSDNTLAQLAALRAGLGVAICQVPLAARDPALVRVLPQVAARMEVWLALAPNLKGSARIRTCAEALGQGMQRYAAG